MVNPFTSKHYYLTAQVMYLKYIKSKTFFIIDLTWWYNYNNNKTVILYFCTCHPIKGLLVFLSAL